MFLDIKSAKTIFYGIISLIVIISMLSVILMCNSGNFKLHLKKSQNNEIDFYVEKQNKSHD